MAEDSQESALGTLNTWLAEHGVLESSALDDWDVSPFDDALLFSSAGQRRANRLYLVRRGVVVAFSPSTTTFDQAYAQLVATDE
ncbi:MAG TPA: hypothetical protein VGM70_08070 [Pseudolysinimonas sp.]|jgi:hypothetical protein